MSYSNEEIYHNCRVLSPEGVEMFRCHRKKFNWYIRKGLAALEPNSTDTIRLKFKPNGLGWAGDHYYLQDRENKCCCCGSNNKLTKHHVVPYCYRREFPDSIKDSNYYDVLPLCVDCHTIYEKHATKKKQNLAERYDAPLQGINNINEKQAPKYARTLVQYGHLIPEDRKLRLIEQIKQETNKPSIVDEDLEKIAGRKAGQPEEYISHSQIVVSKIENFQTFVEEWREHFVQTMKPQHLPKHWNIKRDLHGRKRRKSEPRRKAQPNEN